MTNIYIFNNASRAAGYGIGTYINVISTKYKCLKIW